MISLAAETCIGCLECLAVCPNYVFQETEEPGGRKSVEVRYPEHCFQCGHCIAVCPTQAISHSELALDDFEPLPATSVTSEAMLGLLQSRRSIRNYKPDSVPRDLIDGLLTAAAEAGSSSNGQTEGFVVIQDQVCLLRLESLVVDVLWKAFFRFAGAAGPVRRVLRSIYGEDVLHEAERYRDIIRRRRADRQIEGMVFRNAPMVLIAHGLRRNPLAAQNCALALRNVELLALTLGLGTCWVGFLVAAAKASKRVGRLVGLPGHRQIYGALMIGYPNEHYSVRIPRKARSVSWVG